MVRIIEEKPDPSVVKQVICRNCGVKLEYIPLDVKNYTTCDYGGGYDIVHYVSCPKCENKVTVRG